MRVHGRMHVRSSRASALSARDPLWYVRPVIRRSPRDGAARRTLGIRERRFEQGYAPPSS
jgi:hypothetical protein